MDSKLLLVKIITLLYKESTIPDSTTRSHDLAKTALATVKIPEGSSEFDQGRDTIISLRTTVLWMIDTADDLPYDHATLIQRIRVNTGDDQYLYQALEAGLTPEEDSEALKKQCLSIRGELRNAVQEVALKEVIKQAYRATHFDLDGIDVRDVINQLQTKLSEFNVGTADQPIIGMINSIDLDDIDSVTDYLEQALRETAPEGIMRLGHQAINRMTGDHNGFRRGETIVLGALQHNYKTGMLLTWFSQLCMYNKPYMRDPSKKPLMLLLSTENDTHINVTWLYKYLKENETGEAVDTREIDPREAATYVRDRLQATGYTVKMYRLDPSQTTFQSFSDLIDKLKAENFEIHVCAVDYLNMFNKRGLTQGAQGFESRDLWRRCRNKMSPDGTIFISPHQLSPDAKRLIRTDVDDFVKIIANKGYWDGCTTIDQEVDLEFYIHIVKINGRSYLTVQRGKHRKINPTPEKYLYTVLPFREVGNIPDDINGPDISMKYPGADELGGPDGKRWDMF